MKQSLLFQSPGLGKEGRPRSAEAHVETSQAEHFTAFFQSPPAEFNHLTTHIHTTNLA